MLNIENRTPYPGKAGRVKLTQDNGQVIEGVLEMDDDATAPGTPWNRQSGRLLQADIRTYPVAEGQTITAGDVVDVVEGKVVGSKKPLSDFAEGDIIQLNENGKAADFLISDGTSPSQAIALQGGTAGQTIEVIYSGTVYADWVTAGQTITSDGVYGAGLLDGVLQVWGADRPNTVQIAVVSYVGTGRYGASNPLSITTEFPADVIIRVATSAEEANIENVFTCYNTYCTVIMSEVGEDWTRGIGFSSSETYITNTWSKKSADGRTLYWYGLNLSDCSNDSGRTYYYVAIKF